MNILAVDCNLIHLQKLVNFIKDAYPRDNVWFFEDPMLAAQYAYNHPIDILFTEIPMPRLDGFLLARMVRECHPGIEVNFVTKTNQYRSRSVQFQSSYLLKPISAEAILKK